MSPLLHAFVSQTADGTPAPNPLFQFLPFILIAVVFYFVFFRPQARQAKEHANFLAQLKKGDEVVTQGGLVGVVYAVEDRTVTVDVGAGTKVRIVKQQITGPWKQVEAQPAKTEARK
ncbi:MAG: preprotein translocase subunit YajC [Anaeromyxobacteraceae bacterium]